MEEGKKVEPYPLFHPQELEYFDKYLAMNSELSMVTGFDFAGLPISVIETSENNPDNTIKFTEDGRIEFETNPVFLSAPPGVLKALLSVFVQTKKICYLGHDMYSVNGEATTQVPEDSREWYYPSQEQEYIGICEYIKTSFSEPLDEGLVYDYIDTAFNDPVGMGLRVANYGKELRKRVAVLGDFSHQSLFEDAGHSYTGMEKDGSIPDLDGLPFFDLCVIIHTNIDLEESLYNKLIKELKLKACVEHTSLVLYMSYPEEEDEDAPL
jgi:hypothetical protein